MSRTGVIVALLVAIVLAGVLLLGGKGRAPAPARGPLLAFDPAHVAELRVSRSDGRFESVRRGEQPGMWDVVMGGKGEERVWPADSGRMRAALRILSTLEGDEEGGGTVEAGASELLLTLDEAGRRTMRISSRTLGGKVLVEVGGVPGATNSVRTAWVNADIGEMLVGTGPHEWRDRAALPGLGPDVARITLKGAGGTVSLARVQGHWGLREPVQEAAEPEAVAKLLTALGNVLITDFLDEGAEGPERTGLDKPVAELSIESDQRDADGKNHTSTRELRVGRQADIAGKSVFAGLGSSTSARTVSVSAEALAGLTTDPSAYVSRRCVQAPAADIGGITVKSGDGVPRRFERDLDGWMAVGDGGVKSAAGKADSEGISALLNLFTQMPTEAVAIGTAWPAAWGPDASGRPLATVELSSPGGAPLAKLDMLGTTLPGKPNKPGIVLHTGVIWRVYGADAATATNWVARSP